MSDYIVKLFEIPDLGDAISKMRSQGIVIRKPIGPENAAVKRWISQHFGDTWATEAENAFFNSEYTIYIATRSNGKTSEMLGFACWDATVKDFFGPMGVLESERGKGIGRALLLHCLHGMYDSGYGYAVIGSPGPIAFYSSCCGAQIIEGSNSSVYKNHLIY